MKNFDHITDIFFDLDHTIYDFDKNAELTFMQIFEDLNLEVADTFMQKFRPINDYYWDKLTRKEVTTEALRYGRLKDTFDILEMEVSDPIIYQIADDFLAKLPNFNHVFQGAYESLDYLKSKYRLHIITNGPEKLQELKLKKSKLDGYFLTVTNSENAGVKKPDPAIFYHALKAANVNVENSLMIGDNLDADISGALNVGMDVIWFDEHASEPKKNFTTINKLLQLKNIL